MAYNKPFASSQAVNEDNLDNFQSIYARHLQAAYDANPAKYAKPPEEIVKAIIGNIRNRGIGSIAIETPNFRATAKELGIKNTYQAWREFFAVKS